MASIYGSDKFAALEARVAKFSICCFNSLLYLDGKRDRKSMVLSSWPKNKEIKFTYLH